MNLGIEEDLYNSLPKNIEFLKKIKKFNFGEDEPFSVIDIFKGSEDILIRKRIDIRISSLINDFYANQGNDLVAINLGNSEHLVSLRVISALNNAVEIDEINTFLVILNTFLEREEYQPLISKIMDCKYLTSFVYKEIEKNFLETNFNVSEEIYLTKDFVSGFFMIPDELVRFSVGDVLRNLISIASSRNIDHKSPLDNLIDEIIMRTCLILAQSDLYEVLINQLEKMAGFSMFFDDGENSIFHKILKYQKEDRKRLNNISFGLK